MSSDDTWDYIAESLEDYGKNAYLAGKNFIFGPPEGQGLIDYNKMREETTKSSPKASSLGKDAPTDFAELVSMVVPHLRPLSPAIVGAVAGMQQYVNNLMDNPGMDKIEATIRAIPSGLVNFGTNFAANKVSKYANKTFWPKYANGFVATSLPLFYIGSKIADNFVNSNEGQYPISEIYKTLNIPSSYQGVK